MSKKKIWAVFLSIGCLTLLLGLTSCNKAVASEVVAEVNQKTDVATWFENNLGWFVGIPSGVVLANCLELIGLFKKKRAYTKDLFENSLMRANISKEVTNLADSNVKFGRFVTETQNKLIATDKKIDDVLNKAEEQAKSYAEVIQTNMQLEKKVDTLLQALALMSSQDKDLVANGVAEKINNLVDTE